MVHRALSPSSVSVKFTSNSSSSPWGGGKLAGYRLSHLLAHTFQNKASCQLHLVFLVGFQPFAQRRYNGAKAAVIARPG